MLATVLLLCISLCAVPLTVFAAGTTYAAADNFSVTPQMYINGTAMGSGDGTVYNGSNFGYTVAMKALKNLDHFSGGYVITYHIGDVLGLNLDASYSEDKAIEGTPVGTATFTYDKTTGSIGLTMTFSDGIAAFDHIKMEFDCASSVSFSGLTTGDTVDIAVITAWVPTNIPIPTGCCGTVTRSASLRRAAMRPIRWAASSS